MTINARQFMGKLAGLGLLLAAAAPGIAAPEGNMNSNMNMDMPHDSPSNQEFQKIEQPLGVKLGVTATGVGLIGLELWWFLGSKPKSQKARSQQGIQELDVAVDGGYEPNRIVVQAGQPVRLNFFRKDPSSCLEQVLIPDFRISKTLPLNQRTAIEFTPKQPGDYPFTCGMNMFRGVIQVVDSKDQQHTSHSTSTTAQPLTR